MNTLDHIVRKYQIDLTKKSPFTLLNFNRETDLIELLKELSVKRGVEVGVAQGFYSEVLCREMPYTQIYSVDPWVFYPLHNNFRKAKHYEPMYQEALKRLTPFPNSTIIRKSSMEAAKDFEDESLDFVYIDGDHRFQAVTNDIADWSKKVKKGGLIIGDDFIKGQTSTAFVHPTYVVPAWAKAYTIHPWFILRYRKQAMWMWVNN